MVVDVDDEAPDETRSDPDGDDNDVPSGVWCETGSARAVIIDSFAASIGQLDRELPRARVGSDPEGVHQARVATRRLRSDLRTFGPLLDDDWRKRTRAELARLTDALGAVRDTDVLAIHLDAAIHTIGVEPDPAASILDVVREQNVSARRAMIAVLDDDHTATFLAELHEAAIDPPTTLTALGRAERRLLPLVRRPWRQLARAVARLGSEPEATELHQVRLLAKRARYASDTVTAVFGRDARRFGKAVGQIQSVLGDMNDAEVAVAWLRREGAELEPDAAFAAGRLAHHFRLVADAHRHGWEHSFERARKRSAWLD